MEDVDFSDEFCRFVQLHIPSVDEAELLLAEYRSPEGARGPEWARFQQAFGAAGLSAQQVERSEEHTSELQSQSNLVCRLLLEKKKLVILLVEVRRQERKHVIEPML